MDKIHDQVRLALNEHHSIRIVFAYRTEILDASDFVSSTSTLIKEFLETWRDEANIRHLSVSAYPQHTYSVLDFNNDTYDYNTAHCQISVLPLYLLRRSRSGNWMMFRYKSREKCIAEKIHMLHNFKGCVPLPLLDDHTKGLWWI